MSVPIDGRWFRLRVSDAELGDFGAGAPYGQYHQAGDLVWAEFYAGGTLRTGRLVGVRRPNGAIDAAYCLAFGDDLVAGTCVSVPEVLPDGRVSIADHWQRNDGTRGVSHIDEIPPPDSSREASMHVTDADRPHLLVIATGARLFREYILRSIGPRYRIHMFLHTEPTWETDYIDSWTVLESTLDADAMVAAARSLDARDPVDGVLCWDEARILQTSHVAAALGLPGGDPDMINRCRDKHLTRTALAALGVPQPRSVLVATVDEALAVADEIGYPVILKPRALAASLGVVKVGSAAELREQWDFAHDTTAPEAPHYDVKVLVEEFADGQEISIDSAVYSGQVFPFCLARKEIGYPPFAEEIGHYVDAADPLLTDSSLLGVLEAAHRAIGFTDGVTHTEIMLTADGPKIIEINGRIGGDMIPYLGLRATGADPGLAAAAVACGRAPDVTPDRKLVGGVRFFYVDRDDTVLETIEFDRTGLPPAIDQLVVLMQPGQKTSPPPAGTLWGRIAYATAVGDSVAECRDALDAAEKALRWTGTVVAS